MKHQHISNNDYPILMIKAGSKVNIISRGEMPKDIEYLTFDSIRYVNTPKVFKVDNVIISRELSDKYPNNKTPFITEYNISLSGLDYNELINKK